MHMADALVSPAIAGVASAVAVGALVLSAAKIKKNNNPQTVPLMGVMGAFVFAAQMINFSIPGTGSSGHIIGGVLMAAMMGPWAALLTLASVLVVQCLLFADGGLMALGCNILNMGVCTTLIAYPLIYKPLIKANASFARVMFASIAACVIGLELGAFLVTVETEASGITALGFGPFFGLMSGIHLLIGAGEGIATGLVLYYVQRTAPSLLVADRLNGKKSPNYKRTLIALFAVALVLCFAFVWIASSLPDGLEWSIQNITGSPDLEGNPSGFQAMLESAQSSTSIMPDYDSHWAGIVGVCVVVCLTWGISSLLSRRTKAAPKRVD